MIKIGLELFIPLLVSNVLHMFIVKYNKLSIFNIPINKSMFGKNKTYRGFIFVSFVTGLIQFLFNFILYGGWSLKAFFLGFILGIVYMLFELPNSYLKRKMKIPPGGKPKKFKLLFTILDKTDSTFGVCLTFVLYKNLEMKYFLLFFLSAFFIHLFVSQILFKLRVKESL